VCRIPIFPAERGEAAAVIKRRLQAVLALLHVV